VTAFKTIVCATDFSEPAEAALARAADLAMASNADLHLVHVFRYPYIDYPWYSDTLPESIMTEVREGAEKHLAEEARKVEARGARVTTHLVEGMPAMAIAQVVEETQADLLVIGTRAHQGLAHLVLGSVAEKTARRVPCNVLIVKGAPPRS
jgi:nucleotide-binding universal stress UspA family protein